MTIITQVAETISSGAHSRGPSGGPDLHGAALKRIKLDVLPVVSAIVAIVLLGAPTRSRAATDEKPKVTVTLAQMNTEIQLLRQSLSRTMAALDEIKVAANKERDLSIAFKTFDKYWADLEAQTQKVRQHGTAARARVHEHWEAWHTEITGLQNEKVRERAQKRYAATSKEFEKINDKIADAKEGFAPLAADLKDIHTYLQSDLSKAAVSALSGTIWKMGAQARTVDGKLEDVCKQIERAMKKMPPA